MTLRHRPKAFENLRGASLQDYTITEDEPELSPRTTTTPSTTTARLVQRRIHDDTAEDIVWSFGKFTWIAWKVDGVLLCEYRQFTRAMTVATRAAMEPLADWVEGQLGWERRWILENPVAAKREVVRRFERGDGSVDEGE